MRLPARQRRQLGLPPGAEAAVVEDYGLLTDRQLADRLRLSKERARAADDTTLAHADIQFEHSALLHEARRRVGRRKRRSGDLAILLEFVRNDATDAAGVSRA